MNVPLYASKEIIQDKLKYEYEIVVQGDDFGRLLEQKILTVAQKAKLPGFRAGKAPLAMVERHYRGDITKQVVEGTINETSQDFMKNFGNAFTSRIEVISIPPLGEASGDFVYKIIFEVMPEIPDIDLSKVKLKVKEVAHSDTNVQQAIEADRAKAYTFVDAEESHRIQLRDKARIDFEGTIMGKPFKGGGGKAVDVVVGRNNVFPEFDNELVGLALGGSKDIVVKFPDDYKVRQLAGKEAKFLVTVTGIQVRKSSSSNEELVEFLNSGDESPKFEDFDDYVKRVKETFEVRCQKMTKILAKKALFDQIDELYELELPESLVQQEQKELDSSNSGKEPAEILAEAKRRVKLGMLLMKLGDVVQIVVRNDEVVNFIANRYLSRGVDPKWISELLRSSGRKFFDATRGQILENKVVEYIFDHVEKESEDVSFEDLESAFRDVVN